MVEASPNAIILVSKTGEIVQANKQTEILFNYEQKELIGKKIECLLPARYRENHPNLRNMFFSHLIDRPMGAGRDLFAIKKDGKEFSIEIGLTPIFINNENAVLTTITDISVRKKLEEKEKIYLKKIEDKNKELEQFTYIASHDLRAPLQSISSFTQLIEEQKDKLDDDGKQSLTSIKNSVKRMNELISGLLDFGKIGKTSKLVEVDLNEVLKNVIDDLSYIIKMTNSEIEISKLPTIKSYKTEIRLLFQNLIENALKFRNPNTKPKITINAEPIKNVWKFSVSDNGIGIMPNEQEDIFALFKRTENAKNYVGTGIGLAHCKKIVELHNGEISVESKINEGSIFYFTISKNLEIE